MMYRGALPFMYDATPPVQDDCYCKDLSRKAHPSMKMLCLVVIKTALMHIASVNGLT
jgi:hypothetical protein